MSKVLLHIFLSLLLSLASLTSAHYHEHFETVAITDISDSDAHCDLCAMKSALQNCQVSEPTTITASLPKSISFQPSFTSDFVFYLSPHLPSRAPPRV
ncbi:MAG: hypothetical protein ACK4XY_03310 [Chloroherpetonaceae bacterium]